MANPPPLPAGLGSGYPTSGSGKVTKSQSAQLTAAVPGAQDFFISLSGGRATDLMGRPVHRYGEAGIGGQHLPRPMNVQETLALFAKLPPEQMAQVQSLLYRAGMYSSSAVPLYGHLGQNDLSAFVTALNLVDAQNAGNTDPDKQVDIGMFLRNTAAAADRLGVRDPTKMHAPHVIQLTDAATLSQNLEQSFEDALGHSVSKEEKAKFVASFHAREAAYQEAAQSANDVQSAAGQAQAAGTTPESQGLKFVPGQGYVQDPNWTPPGPGGSSSQPGSITIPARPDASQDAITQQVIAQHPIEAQTEKLGQNAQRILQMMTQSPLGNA